MDKTRGLRGGTVTPEGGEVIICYTNRGRNPIIMGNRIIMQVSLSKIE